MADNNPVDRLGEAVASLEFLLLDNELEPDPERRNWAVFKRALGGVEKAADDVVANLDQAWMFADESMRPTIASRTAMALHDAAVVLTLAERGEKARALLDRALALAQRGNARDAMQALKLALDRPQSAKAATYRRWLKATGRANPSLPPPAPVVERSEPAEELPVESAPTLIRVNGCGAGLYGHRDERADGSYLAAYCISFIFIPVFPLCWYRVIRHDDFQYSFLAKRSLGAAGRVWQLTLVSLAFIAAAFAYKSGWMPRPGVSKELARLVSIEQEGGTEEVLEGYLRLAREPADSVEGKAAADRASRLVATRFPSPCTVDSIEEVRRLSMRIIGLPADSRGGTVDVVLRDRILQCARDVSDSKLAQVELLGMAEQATTDPQDKIPLREKRQDAIMALVEASRTTHPLYALALLRGLLPDRRARESMLGLFESLPDAPAIMAAAGPDMKACLASESSTQDASVSQKISERLERGREAHAALVKELEDASDADLEKMYKRDSKAEEIAQAEARRLRREGQASRGIPVLLGVNAEGRLTYEARVELAASYRDSNKLDAAESTLRSILDELSVPYREAAGRSEEAHRAARERLVEQIKRDRSLPADKELPEDARQWVEESIAKDSRVQDAIGELEAKSVVVRATVWLAALLLQQGLAEKGPARDALFRRAEMALMRLKVAEGDAEYDVQTGIVLHRVGKIEEGEAAFRRVLQGADSERILMAARAYRSIGMPSRARELAESSYQAAKEDPERWEAASLRAVLWTSLDDQKTWLDRCRAENVRLDRKKVEAALAQRDGRLEDAERLLAEVSQAYESTISHDSTDANNAGLVYLRRYEATGNIQHLRRAVQTLDQAAALSPESPVVLGNLHGALGVLGTAEVLGAWIHPGVVRLNSYQMEAVLDEVLLDSSVSDEVRTAIRGNRPILRALQVMGQYSVLAPHDPESLETRISWARRMDDQPALEKLVQELQQRPKPLEGVGVDAGGTQAAASDAGLADAGLADAGSADAGASVSAKAKDEPERRILARALRDAHPPTIATARLLLANRLRAAHRRAPTAALSTEMVELVHQASTDWPALKSNDIVALTLLEAAIARHRGNLAAVERAWTESDALVLVLEPLTRDDAAREAGAALRADKDFIEASEMVRGFDQGGGVLGWELARLLGDDAWRSRAAAGLKDRSFKVTEAYARLEPNGGDARFLALVRRIVGEAR